MWKNMAISFLTAKPTDTFTVPENVVVAMPGTICKWEADLEEKTI